MLNRLKDKAKAQHFDEMKVRYRNADLKHQTFPIKLDIDREATETLTTRRETARVEKKLGQRHDKIRRDLVSAICKAYGQ